MSEDQGIFGRDEGDIRQGLLLDRDEEEAGRPSPVVIGLTSFFGFLAALIAANVLYWTLYRRFRDRDRPDGAARRGITPRGPPPGPARRPHAGPRVRFPGVPIPIPIPLELMGHHPAAAPAAGGLDDLERAEEGRAPTRGRTLAPANYDDRQRGRRESVGRDNSRRRVGAAFPAGAPHGLNHSTSTLPIYYPPTPPPAYPDPWWQAARAAVASRSSSSSSRRHHHRRPSSADVMAGVMEYLEGAPRNVERESRAATSVATAAQQQQQPQQQQPQQQPQQQNTRRRRQPRPPSPVPGAGRRSTVPENNGSASRTRNPSQSPSPSQQRNRVVHLSSALMHLTSPSPYAASSPYVIDDPAPPSRPPPAPSASRPQRRSFHHRAASPSSLQSVDLNAPSAPAFAPAPRPLPSPPAPAAAVPPSGTQNAAEGSWATTSSTMSDDPPRSPAFRSALAGPSHRPDDGETESQYSSFN